MKKTVGQASAMPGTPAFTMAVFKAEDVPVNAYLFIEGPKIEEITDHTLLDAAVTEFWSKHGELQALAHKIAAAQPVGHMRERFFNLFEIIRTAPRESMP